MTITETETETRVITLPRQALATALAATDCTRSTDTTRAALTGWLVRITDETLTVITCNMYAGTRATVRLAEPVAEPLEVLIGGADYPAKPTTLASLKCLKSAKNPKELLRVTLSRAAVGLTLYDGTVNELGLAGVEYPNFDRIIDGTARVIDGKSFPTFNPLYLDSATRSQAAVRRATGDKLENNPVTVQALSELKPAVMVWHSYPLSLNVEHVLMPVRVA